MASIRSFRQLPQSSQPQPSDSSGEASSYYTFIHPHHQSHSHCDNSSSRIFYESEYTTGTSWEFCGISSDSIPLYREYHYDPSCPQSPPQSQMNLSLSVLRSVPRDSSGGLLMTSPMPVNMMIADSSGAIHHRSIPSPPTKDDLSDGSRNSTGSSTGSHRSQDSGFSDSGECRPSKRGMSLLANPININNINSSPGQGQLPLAAAPSTPSTSAITPSRMIPQSQECCSCGQSSSQNLQDSNRNYMTPPTSSTYNHNRSRSSLAAGSTYIVNGNYQYSPHPHQSSHHFRSKSQEGSFHSPPPVPSPIPHLGSGCGKMLMKNGSTFTVTGGTLPQYPRLEINSYGEVNGNFIPETSNCIYHEINGVAYGKAGYMSPQEYQQVQVYHQPKRLSLEGSNGNSNGAGISGNGNYALYGTTGATTESTSGQLGTPICSSTPKRSNTSSSRTTIVQKIDNFECLNKNKHSLDNNNNSNASRNSSNGKNSSKNGNQSSISSPGPPSFSPPPPPIYSGSYEKTGGTGNKVKFLNLSSPSNSNVSTFLHASQLSSLNSSKTLMSQKQRAALPLPPTPNEKNETWDSQNHPVDPYSFIPRSNEVSIQSSHYNSSEPQLKPCLKVKWSPKYNGGLPNGYKRVSSKDLATSLPSDQNATFAKTSFADDDDVIIVKSPVNNDAMRLWLHELRSQTENECFYMLQTKPILAEVEKQKGKEKGSASDTDSGTYVSQGSDSEQNVKKVKSNSKSVVAAIHAISAPIRSIKNVEQMANAVSAEFAKICKNIEFGFLSQVPCLVINLISYVEEFLQTFQGTPNFANLQKLEHKLARSCRRLYRSTQVMIEMSRSSSEYKEPRTVHSIIESENMKRGEGYHVAVSEMVDGIVAVGNLFSQVVDLRLTRDLSCILDTVEGGGVPAKVALKSLVTILNDGGNHLCRLASETRTVRGLLGVILDAKDDNLRILGLRCLATVLCVGEAVKDFDKASGFEIVADFMYEGVHSFDLKIEAVSVLTQATDPWIDLETSLCTLSQNLEKIVVSLTNLIPACNGSEEPFLLVAAAISNLTFLETASIHILRRCNTVSLLINTVEAKGNNFSIFVLDHVATILANMAGVETCRDCIVKAQGVNTLLKFLQKRSNPATESAAEIMACERVQQKSTIAISRLCSEEGVAKAVSEGGGVLRLIQLCRNEKERNYSDGVLIAALATLRKLISVCGEDMVKGLQADDLIQPRLLDSFLLYSSRQESYV